jgi:quercetin dioxygenase-like cupin family protein
MPFVALDTLPARELFPGLRARIVHGERLSHSFVDIEAGASFPEHHHPHEQVISVLEGELELLCEGQRHRLTAGTVYVIPPGVLHAGRALTRCRVLDVFAPVREDYR